MPELSKAPKPASKRLEGLAVTDAVKTIRTHFLVRWIGIAVVILLIASSARHLLLRSTAFDLGIYDQVAFLLSRGMEPISSYLNFHHMGNHTAYSFYLMAIPYLIYPSVYWLFLVQAVCLALGALPTWLLAQQAGLAAGLASAMAAVYLLHPLIFNVNMFDFHPEVMALPVMLTAIWLARADRRGWFCLAILFALGCKDALSVTIAGMGFWLLLFEKRRFCGAVALISGVAWFLIATQWIIPTFSGSEAAALGRYAHLGGDSVLEVALNVFLKPQIVFGKIFSWESLEYLALLFVPFLWGLHPRYLTPLVSAMPVILLNMLSESDLQRDLLHQYSLPVLPFLLVAVIDSLAHGKGMLRQRRWIILWALVMFIALAKYGRYHPEYTRTLDTWQASYEAMALIPRHEGTVITDNRYGAHLSQRPQISLLNLRNFRRDVSQADYVLINRRHPWGENDETTNRIVERLQQRPDFQLRYERDEVYLFTRQKP